MLKTQESEGEVVKIQKSEVAIEVAALEKEFLEVKDVIHESYKEFADTKVGQKTPMRSSTSEQYFVSLGTFDPLGLLGWFEELLKNLTLVQDTVRQSANQSTTMGTPMQMSGLGTPGESRDQFTNDDEVIAQEDFNLKSNFILLTKNSFDPKILTSSAFTIQQKSQ